MSALSAAALLQRMRSQNPKDRLVVAPLLDPDTQLKETQAAVDVRLGRAFSVARPWTQGVAEQYQASADPVSADTEIDGVVITLGDEAGDRGFRWSVIA